MHQYMQHQYSPYTYDPNPPKGHNPQPAMPQYQQHNYSSHTYDLNRHDSQPLHQQNQYSYMYNPNQQRYGYIAYPAYPSATVPQSGYSQDRNLWPPFPTQTSAQSAIPTPHTQEFNNTPNPSSTLPAQLTVQVFAPAPCHPPWEIWEGSGTPMPQGRGIHFSPGLHASHHAPPAGGVNSGYGHGQPFLSGGKGDIAEGSFYGSHPQQPYTGSTSLGNNVASANMVSWTVCLPPPYLTT
jgi:hypothetical protein